MGEQNYVGKYFINNVGQADGYRQDAGDCVWQDSKNLLCALHAYGSWGMAFNSILLIPVHLAKKFKWYVEFDDFDAAIFNSSNSPLEVTMTLKERNEVPSISVPEQHMEVLDILWDRVYEDAGLCVGKLALGLSERPAAGEALAAYLASDAEKHKARKVTIDAIEKMIADAGLSADEVARLALGIHLNNEEKSRVQAEG
jgi:hypothetical protein